MTREDRALLEDAFALDDRLRAERQAEEQSTICTKENTADLIYKQHVLLRTATYDDAFMDAFMDAISEFVVKWTAKECAPLDKRLTKVEAKLNAVLAILNKERSDV